MPVFQVVKWKDKIADNWSRSRKVVLASLHDTPQEFSV
jgi:hypothetical protein